LESVVFRESVWQPVAKFRLKEVVNPVSKKIDGVIIEGEAIDTSQPTRNGVIYDYESCLATHKMLEGRPMLLNHDESRLPVGHVEKVWMEGPKMKYRANLDPEEKDLIRKIKRGDIQNVSIQTLVEEIAHEEDMNTGKPITRAYPSDWAELSIVTIPGYANSSMKLAEAWKWRKEAKPGELKIPDIVETSEGEGIVVMLLGDEVKVRLVTGKEKVFPISKVIKKERLNELLSTANASALATTALAKTIRSEPEPSDFIKRDREQKNWREGFRPLEEALEVVKIINNIN